MFGFGERKIDLQVTERAQDVLDKQAEDTELSCPILGITWGKTGGHRYYKLDLGFFDGTEINEGWLGIAPDFDFIVIQEWILDRIDGKILDIDENKKFIFLDKTTLAPLVLDGKVPYDPQPIE